MKKAICLILILCMAITTMPFSAFAEGVSSPDPEAYPDFADLGYGALYAHATLGGNSKETWQRWHKDQEGVNFEEGLRYFFLPASANDEQVEIYNNYNNAVTIGDVTIEAYTSAFVNYKEGEKITAIRGKGTSGEKSYTFVVYKSDAEASVYVNDTTNSYEDYNGKTQKTDLWSFLIQNKENSVSDSACAIVDENGTLDTTLKKIKGRGNTNWKETDKKPFNLTFYDKTDIGGVVDKKFSFVSNAKDSTLLRNAIMYDLADKVGSPYAVDQSFVDFYVNGVYRGSYIACRKVDLGKNSVVSLKDTSDDVDTGFNFLVEVDVWNYKSDVYFVSDKGFHVVLKTPDLDDYDETDPSMKAKYDYIKNTYQKLEDALYKGTLEDIEKICDLESLASQYLLQEFGKNCDGGYTSTFFTYNAEKEKFYAAPLWDCDSDLGAVDCVREGCSTSTIDHTGWITRIAEYEKNVNPYGQAFHVKGKTSDGKTFEDICKEMWKSEFIPAISILLGESEPSGRLKSIDDYAKSTEKTAYINYIMWNFQWLCAQKNGSLNKRYSKDLTGELQYLKDWTRERANWISRMYDLTPEYSDATTSTESTEPIVEKTVYFTTDLNWDNVHLYAWSYNYTPLIWPGEKVESYTIDENGNKIYEAKVPENLTTIIFNNGADGEQTVNITLTSGCNFYSTTESTGETNNAKKEIYNITAGVYVPAETKNPTIVTEPAESSTAATTPTESTPDSPVVTDPVTPSISTDPTENSSTPISTDATESNTNPTASTSVDDKPSKPVESTVGPTQTETKPDNSAAPTTNPADELLFGDANLDGKVNIKDATALQKHLAKLLTLSEKNLSVSDTNKDGRITISDATAIQKKIAGLIKWD